MVTYKTCLTAYKVLVKYQEDKNSNSSSSLLMDNVSGEKVTRELTFNWVRAL